MSKTTPAFHNSSITNISAESVDEYYQRMLDILPVGIFKADTDGNCLYANSHRQSISGISQKDSFERGWKKALHPEDKDAVLVAWNQAVAQCCPMRTVMY
jgi:two-component system sensor histidine kinase/response regulator